MIHENIELTGSFTVSGSFVLPSHASSSAVYETGSMYHDTVDGVLKVYTGTQWVTVGEQTGPAAGPASANIEYLLVAGGGGGGAGYSTSTIGGGGGGGAGGYLSSSLSSVESGSSITVTVGGGGTGQAIGSGNSTAGTDSSIASAAGTSFSTVTSTGGGRGGSYANTATGGDGGSGGGSAYNNAAAGSGTLGQGFAGGRETNSSPGYGNGGGGGATQAGSDGTGNAGGNGGNGIQSNITGTATYYAGGGGGGIGDGDDGDGGTGGNGGGGTGGEENISGTAGTSNTGGGGGGGGNNGVGGSAVSSAGGSGGSGVAIFAYDSGSFNCAGGIVGDAGNGRKYNQFNSSGDFKVGNKTDFILPKTNELELLWRADDFGSRDTSIWTDLSGNSRNGTVSGASLGNNPYYTFDGSNDQVYISSYYYTAQAQTFFAWLRFTGNGSNGYSLIGWQQGGGYNYFGRTNAGNLYQYIGNGTGGETAYTISNDTWYMFTQTVDASGNHNLYIDTTSRVSNTGISLGTNGSVPFRIGAIGPSANYFHNGNIGMAGVWSSHFTATDIETLYNATKTNFV